MKSSRPRSTDERDVWIGGRIRLARKTIKMSQTALADKVGVTFQQVQKYESGTNRVSVTRLCEIATAVERPIQFFLPLSEDVMPDPEAMLAPLKNLNPSVAIKVLTILDRTDSRARKNIVKLIESIDESKA